MSTNPKSEHRTKLEDLIRALGGDPQSHPLGKLCADTSPAPLNAHVPAKLERFYDRIPKHLPEHPNPLPAWLTVPDPPSPHSLNKSLNRGDNTEAIINRNAITSLKITQYEIMFETMIDRLTMGTPLAESLPRR